VAAKGTLTPEILHFLFAYQAESTERLRELIYRGTSQVTVFEMLPKAGADVGKSTKWILMSNLERHGVAIRTKTKVAAVQDGRILILDGPDGQSREAFDTVVVASGSRPVQRLSTALKDAGIAFTAVGDTLKPGKLNDAIHGGFLAAAKI
jgi:2,4-dienoyl-CoA reductase (NADPH2)